MRFIKTQKRNEKHCLSRLDGLIRNVLDFSFHLRLIYINGRKVMREMEFLKCLKKEKGDVKSVWFGLITIWGKIVWKSFNGMEDFRYWSVSFKCFLDRGKKEEVKSKEGKDEWLSLRKFFRFVSIRIEIYIIIHTFVKKIFNLYKPCKRMNLIPFILVKPWNQNQLLINKFTYHR